MEPEALDLLCQQQKQQEQSFQFSLERILLKMYNAGDMGKG